MECCTRICAGRRCPESQREGEARSCSHPCGRTRSLRVIASVSGCSAFVRLRVRGISARRGSVRAVHRADSTPPAVAFAVPKRVGTAVARNRIRRRLRAVLHDVARDDPGSLAGGDYLFAVSAPLDRFGYAELRGIVTGLLGDLRHDRHAAPASTRDRRARRGRHG